MEIDIEKLKKFEKLPPDVKRQLALLNGTNYSPKDVQVIIDGQRYKVK